MCLWRDRSRRNGCPDGSASIAEQLSLSRDYPFDIKEVVQKEDNEPIYLQSHAKREQNQRVNTQDIMLMPADEHLAKSWRTYFVRLARLARFDH